ncbi:MAG: glycosyltransferase family 9 protein [Sphingobacteriales bacterium]|jgi:ADP-heptose:LPS heptosyltransferase
MKTNVAIIMPPFIGDCIMVIPLINQLALNSKVFIICNDYIFNTFQYLFADIQVLKLSSESPKIDVIIDLLGDSRSVKFVKLSNAKMAIGFPDANYNYTFKLSLPYTFINNQATEIYLASLLFLNVPKPVYLNFGFSKSWLYNNQDLILIAPGAGNLERCFSIDAYIELAKKLSPTNKVCFILGPSEMHLSEFINKQYDIIISSTIETALSSMSKARMLIASEGGFMHLAAAYGVPLIGLFKIASPKNWFPYKSKTQLAIGNGENNYDDLKRKVDFPLKEIILKTRELYANVGN